MSTAGVVIAFLGLVMAGCSVEQAAATPIASSPNPVSAAPSVADASSPSVEPTRTPASSVEPTRSPASTAPELPSASPNLSHIDPELERLLPARLSGVSLTRFSTEGAVFTAGGDMCILICGDEPYRYARELGVDIRDVTIGFAVNDRLAIGMIAYRVRGAATDRLIPARIAIGGYSGHADLPGQPVTVAGRPATYLEHAFSKGEYLMTRHDLLFIVLGEAPADDNAVPAYVTEALGGVL